MAERIVSECGLELRIRKVELPSNQNGYAREMRYFLDSVKGKVKNTVCTAESTRKSVELVMLENKAIAKQKWVKLGK